MALPALEVPALEPPNDTTTGGTCVRPPSPIGGGWWPSPQATAIAKAKVNETTGGVCERLTR